MLESCTFLELIKDYVVLKAGMSTSPFTGLTLDQLILSSNPPEFELHKSWNGYHILIEGEVQPEGFSEPFRPSIVRKGELKDRVVENYLHLLDEEKRDGWRPTWEYYSALKQFLLENGETEETLRSLVDREFAKEIDRAKVNFTHSVERCVEKLLRLETERNIAFDEMERVLGLRV